jgi:hypothetical protein
VVGDAGQRQLAPGDALHALDRADGDALLLEHRALLDMQLDEGAGAHRAAIGRAGVADTAQVLAQCRAVDARDG